MGERVKIRGAVCDDEKHMHDLIQKLMDTYAVKRKVVCEMNYFYSAQELLLFEEKIDFLFLDINMPGMDGIEAARILNARGADLKIIMLSGMVERFKEAFKIGAFRFVTKPVDQREVFEAVDGVREQLMRAERITVYQNGTPYNIMQCEILYVMADKDVTRIYTECAEYRSEQTLKYWTENLDDRLFFMCHRSCIVNLGEIELIERDTAVVATGEKVPVSRRKRTGLLQAYMVYDTKIR